MTPRIVTTLVLILSVFLLPWWLTALMILGALCLFPRYIEGCVVACLFDLVYAGSPLFGVTGLVTYSAVVIYLLATYVLLPRLRHDVFTTA